MCLADVTAIQLDDLTKTYGDVTALQNVDLTVADGEVFGFLGPNGAGKSTTIDILLDQVRPTAGSAEVFGLDAQADSVAVRERTGVLPDGYGTLGVMTGREHVEFAFEAKNADGDVDAVLERVGIAHAADRKATAYSKGMAQRLMLGMAVAGEPDLLLLDEPTTGLDPNGARRMREIVEAERDRGATVFFSSHILEQVEAVCDRVGILDQGRLVAVDSIDDLRETAGSTGQLRVAFESVPDGLADAVASVEGVASVTVEGTDLVVGCEDGAKAAVINRCFEAGTVLDVETTEASLEDIFVSYTGGAR